MIKIALLICFILMSTVSKTVQINDETINISTKAQEDIESLTEEQAFALFLRPVVVEEYIPEFAKLFCAIGAAKTADEQAEVLVSFLSFL